MLSSIFGDKTPTAAKRKQFGVYGRASTIESQRAPLEEDEIEQYQKDVRRALEVAHRTR